MKSKVLHICKLQILIDKLTNLTNGVTQLPQNSGRQCDPAQQVELLLPVRIGVQGIVLDDAGHACEEERDHRDEGDDEGGRGDGEHLEVDQQVDVVRGRPPHYDGHCEDDLRFPTFKLNGSSERVRKYPCH